MSESSIEIEHSKPLFDNRQLLFLIWPLIVEQLLNALVGMVDVVMVSSLGEAAVSGVSLVDALNSLVLNFLAALVTGGTVVCAQYIGRQDHERANKTAAQQLLVTMTGAIALAAFFLIGGRNLLNMVFGLVEPDVMDNAFRYFCITTCSFPFLGLYNACAGLFRATGNSAVSMRTSLLMNGMNVAGNAICIYGLKMGVAGVAIPTLISRVVAAVVLFSLLQNPANPVRIQRAKDFYPNASLIRRILQIGIPGGIENTIFHWGRLMLQTTVATLGTTAIAAFAVANNLVSFLYLPGTALGIGLTTVVGQCVGAGEAEQAKRYVYKFVKIDYAILAVVATALAFGRYLVIGIYQLSPEGIAMAAALVLSHCIAMTIWPLGFVIPHGFRASNDIKFTMVVSISCMWIFRVGLAVIFIRYMHLGILWAWIAMYIDWVVRIIIYQVRMRGFTDRIRNLKL